MKNNKLNKQALEAQDKASRLEKSHDDIFFYESEHDDAEQAGIVGVVLILSLAAFVGLIISIAISLW